MKIALIIEHFDATRGGAEHFTVWLAQELATRGHEVHVVCHDVAPRVNKYRQATQRASHDADRSHQAGSGGGGGNSPGEAAHEGIHIHRIRGMKLNSGIGFRLFGQRARRWCAEHHPDVVHSMTVAYPGDLYQPHAGVYAAMQAQAIASRATGAQSTWKRLMLSLSVKQRTLLGLERRAVTSLGKTHGPQRILSLCRMMTEQFQEAYGAGEGKAEGRIVELPNPRMSAAAALELAAMAEQRAWFRGLYKIDAAEQVAVFVGHDFRRKGLRYAIETIAQLPQWKLLVVGLGKAREYVELANGLGIGDASPRPRVMFVGPTKQMDPVYAASDALLLPTFYDSFGLVVLESLAHGVPVVSTAFLGAAYLVQEHDVGTIVASPKDVGAMARALQELPARDSVAGVALAERARRASAGMLPAEYLEKLLALYHEILNEKMTKHP
jgi:UDP-glucose:(heptosyl)LPS alpha-1,3-glucosyltransferase